MNNTTGPADASLRPAEDYARRPAAGAGRLRVHRARRRAARPGSTPATTARANAAGTRAKPAAAAAQPPLANFVELPQVAGFTREMLDRKLPRPGARSLAEHLTVIPFPRTRPTPVNINTAEPDVLRCILGPSFPTVSETILGLRDRTPFVSIDSFIAILPPREAATAMAFLSVRSDWFTINARAYHQGATASCRVLAGAHPTVPSRSCNG
ncbi:MAG: type II secretion system protein GspK [Kiritimatiellia bacterium]